MIKTYRPDLTNDRIVEIIGCCQAQEDPRILVIFLHQRVQAMVMLVMVIMVALMLVVTKMMVLTLVLW